MITGTIITFLQRAVMQGVPLHIRGTWCGSKGRAQEPSL